MTVPIVIYMRKDFFLLESLNKKIKMMKVAGLIDLWRRQDNDEHVLHIKEPKHPKVLTLKHLYGSFYVLGCGMGLSAVVLMIELATQFRHTIKTLLQLK